MTNLIGDVIAMQSQRAAIEAMKLKQEEALQKFDAMKGKKGILTKKELERISPSDRIFIANQQIKNIDEMSNLTAKKEMR